MSLARQHRERTLAMQAASAPAMGGGFAQSGASHRDPVDPVAAEMRLRLRHDRIRLKQLKATAAKVAAKREMLPAYGAWCDGILKAGRCTVGNEISPGAAPEVFPTIMIWEVDTGNWPRALELAAHLIRFGIALPEPHRRDAATLLVEETAEAAFAVQLAGNAFPLDVLEQVEALVAGIDMHDEVQAKLCKAIGIELARVAGEIDTGATDFIAAATRALEPLRRAQTLHARSGTKMKVAQLEKAIRAAVTITAAPIAVTDITAGTSAG